MSDFVKTNDLGTWKVRGPVRTLRTEFAELDLTSDDGAQWQAPRRSTLIRFRPDGKIAESEEQHMNGPVTRSFYSYDESGRCTELRFQKDGGPMDKTLCYYDGSSRLERVVHVEADGAQRDIESFRYDQSGRKTKVHFVPQHFTYYGFQVESGGPAYGAPGTAAVTMVYDEHERPAEALFQDAGGKLLRRIVLTRDGQGRLLKEEMLLAEDPPFMSPQQLPEDAAAAIFDKAFGPRRAMSSTTYAYDEQGRLSERSHRMGQLGEDVTSFRYDDHGNAVEETNRHKSWEMGMDEAGNLQTRQENTRTQQVRREYVYDSHGNWTECVTWVRAEPNPDFHRSHIERRGIEYYGE